VSLTGLRISEVQSGGRAPQVADELVQRVRRKRG
jgi:hypothetical protein